MEHTKLPLTTWFLAIYLISQAKTGLSALQLKGDIGASYPTASLMHHKIMMAMSAREAQHSAPARRRRCGHGARGRRPRAAPFPTGDGPASTADQLPST